MIPVIEMFASIQGEGKYAGVPTFFIRFSGCNLRCIFKGSICDTPYSSFHPEKGMFENMDEFESAFLELSAQYPHINHICLTGGEPMLHKKIIEDFLTRIWMKSSDRGSSWCVTVETNGTLPIFDDSDNIFRINLYSISPKLSSSVGDINNLPEGVTAEMVEKHNKTRINIENLYNIIMNDQRMDIQLKFVYSDERSIKDIHKLIDDLVHMFNTKSDRRNTYYFSDTSTGDAFRKYINKKIMLMPEGITNEQLQLTRKKCIEECMKYGWHYTDRLHIVAWGDKRGV